MKYLVIVKELDSELRVTQELKIPYDELPEDLARHVYAVPAKVLSGSIPQEVPESLLRLASEIFRIVDIQ
jgi:hypothetical protein